MRRFAQRTGSIFSIHLRSLVWFSVRWCMCVCVFAQLFFSFSIYCFRYWWRWLTFPLLWLRLGLVLIENFMMYIKKKAFRNRLDRRLLKGKQITYEFQCIFIAFNLIERRHCRRCRCCHHHRLMHNVKWFMCKHERAHSSTARPSPYHFSFGSKTNA